MPPQKNISLFILLPFFELVFFWIFFTYHLIKRIRNGVNAANDRTVYKFYKWMMVTYVPLLIYMCFKFLSF